MTDVHPDIELHGGPPEDSDDDFQYEEVEVVRCVRRESGLVLLMLACTQQSVSL